MSYEAEKEVCDLVSQGATKGVIDAVRLKPWQRIFIEVREPGRQQVLLQVQLRIEAGVYDLISDLITEEHLK